MTHANTSEEFARIFSMFPCGEQRYCETLHPTGRHGKGRCEIGVAYSRRFVRMGDSGVFSKDGSRFSEYKDLFGKYRRLRVKYGIIIDHLKDSARTLESAAEAIECYARRPEPFHLVGVAQGETLSEYLDCYAKLRQLGFRKIALGGLLKKRENSKRFVTVRDESMLYGVLRALRVRYPEDWLFALGAYHPKRHNRLDALGAFGGDYKGWIFQYPYVGRKKTRSWLDERRYEHVRHYLDEEVIGRLSGKKTNRNLLVLGCSRTKRRIPPPLPAIERYDGPGFRMVRNLFFDGLHLDVDVMIFSSKFGLITPRERIPYYDHVLGEGKENALCRRAARNLQNVVQRLGYQEVFLSMGKNYIAALDGFSANWGGVKLVVPRGPIGKRLLQTRRWLLGKSNRLRPQPHHEAAPILS